MYQRLINLIGARLASRFRLNSLLGAGSMGGIFSAHDKLLKRGVAIKILHTDPTTGEDDPTSLVQEAQLLARLSDSRLFPNVYDLIFANDRDPSFMVFELLQGKSLWAAIRHKDGPVSTSWCFDIALQLAQSLVTMHDRGIVHQDLKPSNVFLCDTSDGVDFLKILDLGVSVTSRQLGEIPSNSAKLNAGTISYMAPEILSGGEITPKADLYSLGVLLAVLTASEPPSSNEGHATLVRELVSDPMSIPTRSRAIMMGEPFWLLLARMLSSKPSERPHASECLRELQQMEYLHSGR